MGKKINNKIIVQNYKKIENNLWNAYYSGKKNCELSLYIYLILEIKRFLVTFFKKNKLILHNYKINFSESNLKIFVSYFKSPSIKLSKLGLPDNVLFVDLVKSPKNAVKDVKLKLAKKVFKRYILNGNKETSKLSFFKKKEFLIRCLNNVIQKKKDIDCKLKLLYFKKNDLSNYYVAPSKIHNVIFFSSVRKKYFDAKSNKRSFDFLAYKNYMQLKTYNVFKTIKINNFLEKLIESLNVFIKSKFNISIICHQINRDIDYSLNNQQLQLIKKIVSQLRRFKESSFFVEGVNLFVAAMLKKNVSKLLSRFIANNFKAKKKDNVFFKFIKQLLSLLFTNKISKIKSIKILIKGRFNGSRRTRKQLICIGNNMPLMTLNSNVYYSESTSYGPNGTFGIKVWVNES